MNTAAASEASSETNQQNNTEKSNSPSFEEQLKEKENKYLYLYAEFENYKKRAVKERSDLLKFGWENPARQILEVLDNLNRAVTHAPSTTDKTLLDGLHMILDQFEAVLEKQGVKEIDTVNQNFDPNLHEAMGFEPSTQPSGTVTKELTTGYTLHGRLLRAARVIVSSGPAKQDTVN